MENVIYVLVFESGGQFRYIDDELELDAVNGGTQFLYAHVDIILKQYNRFISSYYFDNAVYQPPLTHLYLLD